jgi:hypothetical protein
MSTNGGGGACLEPRSFDHREINLCEQKSKAKRQKILCVHTCMQDSVRTVCASTFGIIASSQKSLHDTMESLSPLTLLGSSSAHPPTKKQRKEGMYKLL